MANTIDWYDDFEDYAIDTQLNGIGGWATDTEDTIVQSVVFSDHTPMTANTRAAIVPESASLSTDFIETSSITSVWIRMDIQPVRYNGEEHPAIDTESSSVFYVNENGRLVI